MFRHCKLLTLQDGNAKVNVDHNLTATCPVHRAKRHSKRDAWNSSIADLFCLWNANSTHCVSDQGCFRTHGKYCYWFCLMMGIVFSFNWAESKLFLNTYQALLWCATFVCTLISWGTNSMLSANPLGCILRETSSLCASKLFGLPAPRWNPTGVRKKLLSTSPSFFICHGQGVWKVSWSFSAFIGLFLRVLRLAALVDWLRRECGDDESSLCCELWYLNQISLTSRYFKTFGAPCLQPSRRDVGSGVRSSSTTWGDHQWGPWSQCQLLICSTLRSIPFCSTWHHTFFRVSDGIQDPVFESEGKPKSYLKTVKWWDQSPVHQKRQVERQPVICVLHKRYNRQAASPRLRFIACDDFLEFILVFLMLLGLHNWILQKLWSEHADLWQGNFVECWQRQWNSQYSRSRLIQHSRCTEKLTDYAGRRTNGGPYNLTQAWLVQICQIKRSVTTVARSYRIMRT